jgi:hypothetical protein
MSDQEVANVARNLAMALNTFAHERRDDDRKNVALLQTELCRVVREEIQEAQPNSGPAS